VNLPKQFLCALASLLIWPAFLSSAPATDQGRFSVPITYYKLPNGLRVIFSPDSTAPTVVTAVYYRIGFRVEPNDRTGFAHLF